MGAQLEWGICIQGIPDTVELTCNSLESPLLACYNHNFHNNYFLFYRFEFIWPAHCLTITPDRGQIPSR